METYFVPILQLIVTIIAIYGALWKFRKDILAEVDRRFDAVDRRLEKIEQNHLDHITQLHVGVPLPNRDKPS